MEHRAEIDGLRALAVVPVILSHAGFELFSGGFVGVDVFFVISGYLITTILIEDIESNRFSLVNFYERRARRILPALFVVMLVCIPFSVWLMTPDDLRDFFHSIIAVTTFSSNILFWLETGYFDQAAELKPLLHTWSLAVEEQYYVLFPIFLFLAWRFGKGHVFWIIVVFAALSLALSEWGWRNGAMANFYLGPARAWELFAGSISAFILQKRGVQANNELSLLGLAAIVFAIFAYDESTPFPSLYTLVPVVGVVLLVLFADKETVAAKLLSTRFFVGIGLISYSAYLWHQPLFSFFRLISLGNIKSYNYIIIIILTFFIAYISWRFIECPFRNSKIVKKTTLWMLSLSSALVFIVVGGAYQLNLIPNKQLHISWLSPEDNVPEKSGGNELNGVNCSARDPQESCTFAVPGSLGDIVIIGDSHARVLTEAAQFFAQEKAFSFVDMSASGCPYLPGLNTFSYGIKHENCDEEYQNRRTKYIAKLEPSLIVIHSRHSLYIHGGGFDNGVGGIEPSRSLYVGKNGRETYEERKALVEQSFSSAIEELINSKHRVVVVGGVPPNGWHPIQRLMRIEAAYGYGVEDYHKVRQLMNIPFDTVRKRQSDISEIFARLMEKYPTVEYVDVLPLFCESESCTSLGSNKKIYYSDTDHLSFEGAKILFSEILRKNLHHH